MAEFDLETVVRFTQWLNHVEGPSELFARHPDYRPGPDHREWNRARQAYPVTSYARNVQDVVRFVQRYAGKYMVCISLNERPKAFCNERGYPRATLETEVELSRNLMIDVDFEDKNPTVVQLSETKAYLLSEVFAWYSDMGFLAPAIGFSGRGYHLLMGYEAVQVAAVPDVSARIKAFLNEFKDDHEAGLRTYDAKVDATVSSLRHMIKIYSTSKPDVKRPSIWHGEKRREDAALRTYLIGMRLDDNPPSRYPACEPIYGPSLVAAGSRLPLLFQSMLRHDKRLDELWRGRGKVNGDRSATGYDYSLVRKLLALGYRNVDDLATVLALRPDGAVKKSGKGEEYLRRTIANALAN